MKSFITQTIQTRSNSLGRLERSIVGCCLCPRLVQWRGKVAREKVARFNDCEYWGKAVPGFGDPDARLLIVGLAPAAHGANRTGRMFTGDRSGDWLYRALYRFGFSSSPISVSRNDGLMLRDCYITAAVRCAPPGNKPLPRELQNCRPFLLSELRLLKNVRVIMSLGKIAFDTAFTALRELGTTDMKRKPSFGHAVEVQVNGIVTLIGSYHPSQQNTFTGKLTEEMFHSVFQRAEELIRRLKGV